MTEREAFEDWLVSDAVYFSPARGPSGLYTVPATEVAWWSWQASRKQALEEAHDVLGGWQRADTMRLRAGEMTSQEVRSVKAILGACQFAIRSLTPTGEKA